MLIFDNLKEWVHFRRGLAPSLCVGFVPTMGNLHQGHLSLCKESLNDNDFTVVSIFVNPMQFNQADDFKNYPRTLDVDLTLLQDAGVDACILPKEKELYQDKYRYRVEEQFNYELMEGKYRPGHFSGVLTVVLKLFNLVAPHNAYFGEKDYQQYALIKEMAEAFFMNIHVHACPTVREASGLALSSRNNRLTSSERTIAEKFANIFHQPYKNCLSIEQELKKEGIVVDYVMEYQGRRFIAVWIGLIRLIDNYECKYDRNI